MSVSGNDMAKQTDLLCLLGAVVVFNENGNHSKRKTQNTFWCNALCFARKRYKSTWNL